MLSRFIFLVILYHFSQFFFLFFFTDVFVDFWCQAKKMLASVAAYVEKN